MLPDYLPALVTPFTDKGTLDLKAHYKNLSVLSERGIEGFLVGGSTGEGPYLEPGDRTQLVKTGKRRKTYLMCGIAAETTRQGLAQVDEAVAAGADSVLVQTPTTMARGRHQAVADYYQALANHSKVPLLLYSVPVYTAYSLPVDIVAKLARHPNIVGMKDSSGDVARIQSIVDATPASFIVYNGASRALNAAMAIGCYGAISASGNYAPELVVETMRQGAANPVTNRKLQKRLTDLSGAVEAHGVPGVKAASKAAGLEPGLPRLPLSRLPRALESEISKLINAT